MRTLNILLLTCGLFVTACGSDDNNQSQNLSVMDGETVKSSLQRDDSPVVAAAQSRLVTDDIRTFAVRLFEHSVSDSDTNLLFSPYSIYTAMAMTFAGADGSTAMEFATALPVNAEEDSLHAELNSLDLRLAAENDGFRLNIVNQLWAQTGYVWKSDFLDTLALNYGAGLRTLDFQNFPEQSRLNINDWVSGATNSKITDLIPENGLNSSTALVITNAILFQANWQAEFDANLTNEKPFTLLDGTTLMPQTMLSSGEYEYYRGVGYQSIKLPYKGNQTSFLIMLPDESSYQLFESNFDVDVLAEAMANLQTSRLELTLPRFSFAAEMNLAESLAELGMSTAFTSSADFSRMADLVALQLDDVRHKAFIQVDEAGTEAAAATSVAVGTPSAPIDSMSVMVNRPFMFAIIDETSEIPLFLGRVLNP